MFIKFPKVKSIKDISLPVGKTVELTGTVKLHGSNCGIMWNRETDRFTYHTRTVEVNELQDYCGFVKTIKPFEGHFRRMFSTLPLVKDDKFVSLYGEWVGPGVGDGRGTATYTFPEKHWALFSLRVVSSEELDEEEESRASKDYTHLITRDWCVEESRDDGSVRPIVGSVVFNAIKVNYTHPLAGDFIEEVRPLIEALEEQCPYGMLYGLKGSGEGYVFRNVENRIRFKVKTPKFSHKELKVSNKTFKSLDEEKAAKAGDLVNSLVDQDRLQQGLTVLKQELLEVVPKNTKRFIDWVVADVREENQREIQEAGLTFEDIKGAVAIRARVFYTKECNAGL